VAAAAFSDPSRSGPPAFGADTRDRVARWIDTRHIIGQPTNGRFRRHDFRAPRVRQSSGAVDGRIRSYACR